MCFACMVFTGDRHQEAVRSCAHPFHTFLRTLHTTKITLWHSMWETVHIPGPIPFHFNLFKHINRAPWPGVSLRQITWFLDQPCVYVRGFCCTKQQRFANSRLCDVQSFYSLSSSLVFVPQPEAMPKLIQSVSAQCGSDPVDTVWRCTTCGRPLLHTQEQIFTDASKYQEVFCW